ncbi:MAG TPA: zinc ribbon domain-containing protein, partial [Longimicrobiales bacterium]|nr:zinc ribbon domain-containing protein [Longimicrobiales bacterium]
MRCSTCGENLEPGQVRCPTCGTVVSAGARTLLARAPLSVKRCPRCGYKGEGVSYFSRPGHVGLLVGVSLFTYGVGGVVYWLARRKHRVCPNCGLGWEHASRAVLTAGTGEPEEKPEWEEPEALPSSGIKRRVLGAVMILFASFLIMMGIIEFEAVAIAVGSIVGVAGSGTFFWGWKALQERRQALMTGLQRKVLRLA